MRKALERGLEPRMMMLPSPPGMHRKSLEAAQQLQESEADGEASDGREDPQQQQPPQQPQQPSGEPQSEQQEQQKRQQQALSGDHHHGEAESGGFPREHPHFPMEKEVGGGTSYNPTRPEPTTSLHAAPSASQPTPAPLSDDLRSSSIAVLRQKAQEHAARMSLNNNMAGLHHPEPLHHHHLGHF
ncbi:ell-associated factor Eaf-like [Penaeus japonicus]|uniref:ell-associated factor Eaf-like n=1 Tax=Penaeus japonicus TaxID=27405 RepID=UPI001C712453|nr:ell-associated factor Eaf-like [Penaeus japonicus]